MAQNADMPAQLGSPQQAIDSTTFDYNNHGDKCLCKEAATARIYFSYLSTNCSLSFLWLLRATIRWLFMLLFSSGSDS